MTSEQPAGNARAERRGRIRTACVLSLILLLFGIVVYLFELSLFQYPFVNARWSLNAHLKHDFGVELLPSAKVENACWVGARDPEELFAITMPPADAAALADRLKDRGQAKGYHFGDYNVLAATYGPGMFGQLKPSYRIPSWWNSPVIPDPSGFTFLIEDSRQIPRNDYKLLFSPSTGRMYIAWGGI